MAISRVIGPARVVFDNAEDPRSLASFLPHGPGQVLITSRNPSWRGLAAEVSVGEFTRSESLALIHALAPALVSTDADRIAAAVGDLPLVVDQAASLIADTQLDVDTYLHLLNRRATELLTQEATSAYPVSTTASWTVAFDRLAADDPSALDLLTLVAWCGPEPLPLTLLTEHPALLPDHLAAVISDPLALAQRTQILQRRGMATVTAIAVGLHRVPAALLRVRTSQGGPAVGGWAAVVVRLLRQALPGKVWNNPTVWPRWQQLLPHVLAATDPDRAPSDVSEEMEWLLDHAAGYQLTRGEPRAAQPLLQRAHIIRRFLLGDDHSNTLTAASNLATALSMMGDHQQARALGEDTLIRRRRTLGDDHPDTLASASNLALDLGALGENRQARVLDEDTLARRRQSLGDDHPDTLSSASNLAADLAALGDYRQARELNEDTLARYRRVLGDEHPDTLRSRSNLALDLHARGDYQQARTLEEDILAAYRRVLGDDHPDTLAAASHLAAALVALGELAQARSLNEDILARRRRVLGDEHPDTLASDKSLAAHNLDASDIPGAQHQPLKATESQSSPPPWPPGTPADAAAPKHR